MNEQKSEMTSFAEVPEIKETTHPVRMRLNETGAFCITSPSALVGAGFVSLGIGMFTAFRYTPVLLYAFLTKGARASVWGIPKIIFVAVTFSWLAILFIVLFLLGLILTLSEKIRTRKVLLLHPWGLLFLYLDVFIWTTMAVLFHLEVGRTTGWDIGFGFVYFDSCLFFLGYYVYATYFIVAELTVIERFY